MRHPHVESRNQNSADGPLAAPRPRGVTLCHDRAAMARPLALGRSSSAASEECEFAAHEHTSDDQNGDEEAR